MEIKVKLEEIEKPAAYKMLVFVRDDHDFDIGVIGLDENKIFVHDLKTDKYWALSARNLWSGYFDCAHAR